MELAKFVMEEAEGRKTILVVEEEEAGKDKVAADFFVVD